MQRKTIIANTTLAVLATGLFLTGCASNIKPMTLTDMQAFALCRPNQQAQDTEKAIMAEYGFKKFAKNTYSPVIEKRLLGHKIRLIVINDRFNILYVSGEPEEFKHHFAYLLKEITCNNGICNAPINKEQTLKFYKAKIKKSKYTTVLECNKVVPKNSH